MKLNLPTYWYIMATYLMISLLAAILYLPESSGLNTILLNRLVFVGLLLLVLYLKTRIKDQLFQLISLISVYAFLGSVYSETAILNTMFFEKQDALVSHWDEVLFGFQPALEFSKQYGSMLFSELMFMGYFSYYLMPLFIIFSLYKSGKLNHFGFLLIGSFVLYYLVFILFPVAGPQFYFDYPENHIQAQGWFAKRVKLIQQIGEAPTAAFPSSHVGVTVIMLLFLNQYFKKLLIYIIPFALVLFFSTVYIKAHYAVDVFAGILSGWIIYKTLNSIYLSSQKP
ncbi:phosphatase PAP2 family protein [Weeksellaceae bacterium KMM 9713]|uniref:Phosphatase PAP2 family protein n=1 Tax=Profundicola chukchiensis TaxID=2961959 RepID=A0A9X4N4C2_9FLAO|nr:phosphatase PAP2 family protein [Profundicola chukchiensis]MDG4946854.1 phosphatase PAP2 family protein [Profundicola chukchiensis]